MHETFRQWLTGKIRAVLSGPAPLLLWCDPDRCWRDLLQAVCQDHFELWADPDEHELALRDRFGRAPRTPRVVWLPRAGRRSPGSSRSSWRPGRFGSSLWWPR